MSPTVDCIQRNAHSRAALIRWSRAAQVLAGTAAVALPVLLRRGHILWKPLTLGIGAFGLCNVVGKWCGRRVNRAFDEWKQLESCPRLKQSDVEPYLFHFPEAYGIVEIDLSKTNGSVLRKAQNQQLELADSFNRLHEVCDRGPGVLLIGVVILWGAALIGRGVQGWRPWQSWAAIVPLSAMLTLRAIVDQKAITSWQHALLGRFVEHALNPVASAELTANQTLSEATEGLLKCVPPFSEDKGN